MAILSGYRKFRKYYREGDNFRLASTETKAETVFLRDNTTVEEKTNEITTNIGNLKMLDTTSKKNLVSAINEVFRLGSDVKTGLVTALIYSNLGITSEMSWNEIFTILSETYPEPPDTLVIFDGKLVREGDNFKKLYYRTYDSNSGHSDGYLSDNVLYAEAYTTNYDRVSYGGGMLTIPIDITNYTKMHVEISNSTVSNPAICGHSIGLRKNLIETGSKLYDEDSVEIECKLTQSHITEMDLTEYKQKCGNLGYFIYSAQKGGTGTGVDVDSKTTVSISKVWFS